jgi:hypothetical protein
MASWSQTYGITDEVTPTPMPAPSATGSSRCGTTAPPPSGVIATAAISMAAPNPSIPRRPVERERRCASTMYSANSAALAKAKPKATATPRNWTRVSTYTPATASPSATLLRADRSPTAASRITGRNSIADTVPSGSRAIAS